jgi:hypothetical protein
MEVMCFLLGIGFAKCAVDDCISSRVDLWTRRGPGWNVLVGQSLNLEPEPSDLPLGVTTGRYGSVKWLSIGGGVSCLTKDR